MFKKEFIDSIFKPQNLRIKYNNKYQKFSNDMSDLLPTLTNHFPITRPFEMIIK